LEIFPEKKLIPFDLYWRDVRVV